MPTIDLTADEMLLIRASIGRERDEEIHTLKALDRDFSMPSGNFVLTTAWSILSKLEAANAND
jgi:hypothetical protein